jgi:hypothetical protein
MGGWGEYRRRSVRREMSAGIGGRVGSKIPPRLHHCSRSLREPDWYEEGDGMKRLITLLFTMMLVASACSSDGSESASNDEATPETTAAAIAATTSTTTATPSTTTDANDAQSDAPAAAGSGAQTATVSLDNGEVFEFSALCWLETQESAGSEILFTVVSYDDPVNLDVTQFGADSFGGAASISLYDSASYDTLWEANSLYHTEIELVLDGSTVTGSGDFYPQGDIAATPVPGQLVANC